MEFDPIPIAVRNWLALRPEERWWLFGMTALTTKDISPDTISLFDFE